ncbi:FtsH protease activity modulator HflK [Sphingomonas sp. LB-2]|uniref:FtsH protease activity modulator HflK n=1 Tax=Sphingomonas caeni TaxID=2984949 RepID=UPI00222E4164|nr:FtsH protease activity modulator HflK [Sphingomonas caeni]MCW3847177.1 FtsH protease activity modulator HflK [Sphingomonas caeni]
MAIHFRSPIWISSSENEPPKSPWGGGGKKGSDDSPDGGKGGPGGGSGNGGGPRNPWSVPPGGPRPSRGPGATLDDLFKRARRGAGGGGGGGIGGGLPGVPLNPRVWLLIGVGLALLWVGFTSIHSIQPQERGVVTTLGRYSGTLEPGWSFTLPAPISEVEIVNVQNVRTESFPESGNGENLMITGDQNIVDLAFQVRWDISNAPDFAFQIKEPKETVRAVAESAMRAAVARASLNDTIGSGRTRIEAEVQIAMQQVLDEYNSGIRVLGVAIKNASAPQAVDDAFKDVTAAQQDAQAARNNANAYAQQVLAGAQGEAAEFDKIYEQYKLAPEVTRRRIYYETMENVLSRTNKVIVETPGVTPYLPLPDLKRREPEPDIEVQGKRPGGTR